MHGMGLWHTVECDLLKGQQGKDGLVEFLLLRLLHVKSLQGIHDLDATLAGQHAAGLVLRKSLVRPFPPTPDASVSTDRRSAKQAQLNATQTLFFPVCLCLSFCAAILRDCRQACAGWCYQCAAILTNTDKDGRR